MHLKKNEILKNQNRELRYNNLENYKTNKEEE